MTAKILLVEDDISYRAYLVRLLAPVSSEYELVQATDLQAAKDCLSQDKFVFAVVDLSLPKSSVDLEPRFQNGKELLLFIADLAQRPQLRVTTGFAELPVDIANVLAQLSAKVLSKDASMSVLAAEVRQYFTPLPTDIVMKFGGTSIGTPAIIGTVAGIVARYKQQTSVPCTVVVSAMSKVTDSLLAGAKDAQAGNLAYAQDRLAEIRDRHAAAASALLAEIGLREGYLTFLLETCQALAEVYEGVAKLGELSLRSLDRILGYGERLSAPLLAAVLEARGIKAQAVDATEVIVTDDVFGSASPLLEETTGKADAILKPLLQEGVVPVVTGFIASTPSGIQTTLGRGGSDYTATILGTVLDAKEVWIWTDVTGVKDADPNLVPDAMTIEKLTYERAAELTYHGAKVLYAKALVPVMSKRIPVRILNTFAPDDQGTLIGTREAGSYAGGVLVSSSGLGLVTVSSDFDQGWNPAVAARALDVLARADIEVMSYSQSFSQHILSIMLRETDAPKAASVLNREFRGSAFRNRIRPAAVQLQLASVSIVGAERVHSEVVGSVMSALGAAGIDVLGVMQVPTESSFSLLVHRDALRDAVLAVHAATNRGDASIA
jgi:bifunctional aspartokinase / homoserine dehydrogenase 1